MKIAWKTHHRAIYLGGTGFFLDFGIRPHDDNRRGWSFFLDHPWKESCL